MAISNVTVVDTSAKHIVKSIGIGSEDDQIVVDAEELTSGTNKSTVSLIECYYQIKGTGTLDIEVDTPAVTDGDKKLSLTGRGKYGLRPGQLKFGNDKQFKLTTDSNVKSYLLVTEFRRN